MIKVPTGDVPKRDALTARLFRMARAIAARPMVDVQTKYCHRPQRGRDRMTAAQVVGGFMMDLGHAPWDAEYLLELLEAAGFEIVLKK